MTDWQKPARNTERLLEKALFASRWLLAPFYVGLAFALGLLMIKMIGECLHLAAIAFKGTDTDVILGALSLVDLTLTGSLLVIVIFSGYENFVSKLDLDGETDRPPWMGTVDFSGLKMKLIASIVAISGIQLLKFFMNMGLDGRAVDVEEALWGVIIHLTFVASGVLLALMDWLTSKTDKH